MKFISKLVASIAMLAFVSTAQAKTAVLVHGAFADGSCWSDVIPLLKAAGFKVIAVQNPLTSLTDDVNAATRAIENQTEPVVLVGHSWGGAVVTQAGDHPNVASLVYVAAFAPDIGQSANDTTAGYPTAPGFAYLVVDKFGFETLNEEGMTNYFAQDLPKEKTSIMYSTQGPTFTGVFTEKLTKAAWKTKPSTYIVAENDQMIQPDLERAFAAKIKATTISLPASHVVMQSKPVEVAAAIIAAAPASKK